MPNRGHGTSPGSGSVTGSCRAGAQVLSLFAAPLNSQILRALAAGPRRLSELRQAAGGPAQTTLRAYLSSLIDVGVVAKIKRNGMPYAVSHELSPQGQDLLFVLDVLEAWLAQAPEGEVKLGTGPAKAAIKAFTDGWDATIVQALVSEPRSLTELDNLIAEVSYPALERRLSAMRFSGLAQAVPSQGNGTPYGITEWARRGIAPLIAAARWEHFNLSEHSEPLTWVETEAGFLMALGLVELPASVTGECVLALDTKGVERRIAGVHVVVDRGRIVSSETDLASEPPTFALGSTASWLEAVIERRLGELHTKGDRRLLRSLVEGIHSALFQ
jgi:DNA-binding HxlR family transcriptional regulator